MSALEGSRCAICNIRTDCPFGTSTTALRSNPTVWSAGPLTTALPIVGEVHVQPSGTPTLPVPSGKLYVFSLMSAGGIDCRLLPPEEAAGTVGAALESLAGGFAGTATAKGVIALVTERTRR